MKSVYTEERNQFISGISSFDTWKAFLLKAAQVQLANIADGALGGSGDRVGGFLQR